MIGHYLKDIQAFLALYDNIYDSIIVVDKNSNMVYMNNKAKEIIAKEDMLGKKVEKIEPLSMFLEVLKTGKPIYNYRQLIETAGIEVITTYYPIKEGEEIIGAIGVGRTISAYQMYNFIFDQDIAKRKAFHDQSRGSLPVPFQNLIGDDKSFQKILFKGAAAAGTDANVLLLGESGVGKEVFSRAIHSSSKRDKAMFIVVNCAAIPDNLLEAELFGYEPGAFTGASLRGRKGKLELAHKGTLFLDEIGDLPQHLQAKLLRAIQFKSFEKVGGNDSINVDIRIIAASNRDLWSMVKEGKFRPDLFYRLNVMPITIPPLRERKKDIVPLCNAFLTKLAADQKLPVRVDFSEDALKKIMYYEWPGNIRELGNVMEHAFVMANSESSPLVQQRHLPRYLQMVDISRTTIENFFTIFEEKKTLPEIIQNFESEHIKQTLKEHNYSKKKTLETLGISKGAFYQKLKRYNIE